MHLLLRMCVTLKKVGFFWRSAVRVSNRVHIVYVAAYVVCATAPLAPHVLVEVLVQVLSFRATHALELVLDTRPVSLDITGTHTGHWVNEVMQMVHGAMHVPTALNLT